MELNNKVKNTYLVNIWKMFSLSILESDCSVEPKMSLKNHGPY